MDPPNVVLIVLDTARSDVVTHWVGDPALGPLLGDFVIYSDVVSPAPWSLPAHASIFTGKYPRVHGLHESRERREDELRHMSLGEDHVTLPQLLRSRGYNTVGISANDWVSPGRGFGRGFSLFTNVHAFDPARNVMDEISELVSELKSRGLLGMDTDDPLYAVFELARRGDYLDLLRLSRLYLRARRVVLNSGYPEDKGGGSVIRLIERGRLEEPFFLFMNLMEMHQPYRVDMPRLRLAMYSKLIFPNLFGYGRISPRKLARIRKEYYREASIVEKYLARFIRYLRGMGLYDNSMIVITGDHGQSLGENGFYGHGIYLYDEIIEVPLLIKYPRGRGIVPTQGYRSTVRIIDHILSTVDGGTEAMPTDDTVFSESYGITHNLSKVLGRSYGKPWVEERRASIDCERIAVYRDGYKLVINRSLNEIEEFKYRGKESPLRWDIINDLLRDVEEFIHGAIPKPH
jgi:arylsulfatase A-like enzyme